MTNSSPKNNKIERHGTPNGHGKQKRSPNYIKTATYFANGGGNSANNTSSPNLQANSNNNSNGGRNNKSPGGRQSTSPLGSSAKNIPRASPVRHDSPRGSPTNNFYAGAKFSEPPSPSSLPKPPVHWTGLMMGCRREIAAMEPCHVSQNFKMILNIQA